MRRKGCGGYGGGGGGRGGGGGGGGTTRPPVDEFWGKAYTGYLINNNSKLSNIESSVPTKIYNGISMDSRNIMSRGDHYNAIHLNWNGYTGSEGFRIYRSDNGGDYEIIFDLPIYGSSPNDGFFHLDDDIDSTPGNTYSYYVTAYNSTKGWEAPRSKIVTITIDNETFLPPITLLEPENSVEIENPEQVFEWNPFENEHSLPYGEVECGRTFMNVIDTNTDTSVFFFSDFDDFTTSQVNYDGDPLIPGRTYRWYVGWEGRRWNNEIVATSLSKSYEFTYVGEQIGITDIYATAITYQDTDIEMLQCKMDQLEPKRKDKDVYRLNQLPFTNKGITERVIRVEWGFYSTIEGFEIYRSVNGGEWALYDDWPVDPGYNYYIYYDYDVSESDTYSYYVKAYKTDWESKPSPERTIDTWLPPCSLKKPVNGEPITIPNPVFEWNPVNIKSNKFPYGGPSRPIINGDSVLCVVDDVTEIEVWEREFSNMTTSIVEYNDDNRASSLITNSNYYWFTYAIGYDEDGEIIAISLSDVNGFTTELTSSTVRRALLVGVGEYENEDTKDLPASPYDVARMCETLEKSYYFAEMEELIDLEATKYNILNGITNTFAGADDDDVSYFYFSGHGSYDKKTGVSYLYTTEGSWISVSELEGCLNAIPGTKVVFLDSCHSGGFINKGMSLKEMSDYAKSFNDNVINVFSAKSYASKHLDHSPYQVLTSCLSTESCWEVAVSESSGEWIGVFSWVLCGGCGYPEFIAPYPADSNTNGEITLKEAYIYTDEWVDYWCNHWNNEHGWTIGQDTQVYPEDSYFVIIEEPKN